jgi:AraC family transcriptional regulator
MDFESSVETDVIEVESSTALVTLQLHSFRWERPTVSHFHSPVAGLLDLALPTRLPSGRGRYADDRVQKRVLGDIFYVPRNLRLEGYAGAGRQRSLWCLLQTQRISELGEIDDVLPSFENCSDVANPEIRTNLLRMGNELAHPGFASALLIDALAISTFVELQRHMRGAGNYKPSSSCVMAPWQLRAIEDRLQADLPAPDLNELAQICRVSSRHLMRVFRNTTGETVGAYTARVQMRRAKELLSRSDRPIKQISHGLGFASAASFSRAFRLASGMSPNKFRRDFRDLPQ